MKTFILIPLTQEKSETQYDTPVLGYVKAGHDTVKWWGFYTKVATTEPTEHMYIELKKIYQYLTQTLFNSFATLQEHCKQNKEALFTSWRGDIWKYYIEGEHADFIIHLIPTLGEDNLYIYAYKKS